MQLLHDEPIPDKATVRLEDVINEPWDESVIGDQQLKELENTIQEVFQLIEQTTGSLKPEIKSKVNLYKTKTKTLIKKCEKKKQPRSSSQKWVNRSSKWKWKRKTEVQALIGGSPPAWGT